MSPACETDYIPFFGNFYHFTGYVAYDEGKALCETAGAEPVQFDNENDLRLMTFYNRK